MGSYSKQTDRYRYWCGEIHMRYDKRIYFIRKSQEEYDPIKGEWVGGATYAVPKMEIGRAHV